MRIQLSLIVLGAAVHLLGRHPWDFFGMLVAGGGAIWLVVVAFQEPPVPRDPYDFLNSDVFQSTSKPKRTQDGDPRRRRRL